MLELSGLELSIAVLVDAAAFDVAEHRLHGREAEHVLVEEPAHRAEDLAALAVVLLDDGRERVVHDGQEDVGEHKDDEDDVRAEEDGRHHRRRAVQRVVVEDAQHELQQRQAREAERAVLLQIGADGNVECDRVAEQHGREEDEEEEEVEPRLLDRDEEHVELWHQCQILEALHDEEEAVDRVDIELLLDLVRKRLQVDILVIGGRLEPFKDAVGFAHCVDAERERRPEEPLVDPVEGVVRVL